MKKFFKISILLLFTIVFCKDTIIAQNYGLGLKISTRGIGVDVIRSFGSQFNIRLGGAYYNIAPEGEGAGEDYKYAADVNLLSVVLLGDYFPFDNIIRLTGGVILNLNAADLKLIPAKSYTVGGDTYDPETMGTLSANVDFNRFAPYIGLGLGNPLKGGGSFQFTFDIGTMYQGGAAVDLSATGMLEPSAAPDQEQQLEDNLSWFKWYPVVSLGMVYKF